MAPSRIPEIFTDEAQKIFEEKFPATWISTVLWGCHVERSAATKCEA
jgi:hypothetical protein